MSQESPDYLQYQFLVEISDQALRQDETACFCFAFVDLPADRNTAGTILGYKRHADVLSTSTNIRLMHMSLYFYIVLHILYSFQDKSLHQVDVDAA